MPVYEFQCAACTVDYITTRSVSQVKEDGVPAPPSCSTCGGETLRKFGIPQINMRRSVYDNTHWPLSTDAQIKADNKAYEDSWKIKEER